MNYKTRIIRDPTIMTGKPVVKGTRIPVELVLKKLADDMDVDVILRDYPRLSKHDIRAVIYYALNAIEGEKASLYA